MPTASVEAKLKKRLSGDRTGGCVAAAVIGAKVESAFVCANAESARSLEAKTALEIGSITKTMTGFLLADAIARDLVQLDDPLELHLPEGTSVPHYQDAPIRLRHLVTHTSGLPSLPSRLLVEDPENPYAALTEADLLASLTDVELTSAPGQQWAYSNFGFLLLSYVLAQVNEESLEALLNARLFEPLGMAESFIESAPPGVAQAAGHLSTGSPTKAWDFPVALAGVGGVRASLNDMALYTQAVMGEGDAQVVTLLEQALTPVASEHGAPEMGLAWFLIPLGERTLAMHDGATGGFSSLLAIDKERQRGVVLLLDTSWANLGGIDELALHLLDPGAAEMRAPRLVDQPQPALLNALAGRYSVAGLELSLRAADGALFAQAEGQPEFELGYDSYGDFFPLDLDALLTPISLPGDSRRSTRGRVAERYERSVCHDLRVDPAG